MCRRASDASCDPLASMRAAKRFLLLDSTEIELPPIARSRANARPRGDGDGRLPLCGRGDAPETLSAELRSKIHRRRGDDRCASRGLRWRARSISRSQRRRLRRVRRLPLRPSASLDSSLLEKLDMPVRGLARRRGSRKSAQGSRQVTTPVSRSTRRRREIFSCCRRTSRWPAIRPNAPTPIKAPAFGVDAYRRSARSKPATPGRDLFAEWDQKAARRRSLGECRSLSRSRGALGQIEIHRRRHLDEGRAGPKDRRNGVAAIARSRSDRIFSARAAKTSGPSSPSPNVDTLVEFVGCLVDPRVSRQIAGRVSVLDMSQAKIDVSPVVDSRFVMTQPLSLGNARLIAAGWLSLHARSMSSPR